MSLFRALLPESASSMAGSIDAIYVTLLLVCGLVTIALFVTIITFAVRYRAGSRADREGRRETSLRLELAWTVAPMVIFLVFFVWGARVFMAWAVPPPSALPIYVVGKQWMWKIQHVEGRREIDEIHVPVGVPVVLTMTSEDVIHDVFIPAFRVKKDVLPGRYTTVWFQATKPGRYHLFCSQYCGTDHAAMGGWVEVMEPAAYQAWLSGGETASTMAQQGEALFTRYQCGSCHGASQRGPQLAGVLGSKVPLQGGGTATADADYLRESILRPRSHVRAGYDPIMPAFEGELGEADVLELIAYIESLSRPRAPEPAS